MRQSELFSKTRKEAPKDEVSTNAKLLIRAGFIHKEMAGVYSFLPLGLRVINKIVGIIREEMNAIGGQEISMSALQDKQIWTRTDRWDDNKVDIWFKTALKNGTEVGLGMTHEEPLTRIMSGNINSYRDLPAYVYQFQTKFRNEIRAKSGIMRGREFLMKDLYSFSRTEKEHANFYEQVKHAYTRVFDRTGIGGQTYITFASGGMFSKFSHEFQTVSDAGEDLIYVDENNKLAINREVFNDEVLHNLGIDKKNLVEKKAIEVGNIFSLGTKFSEPLGLTFVDEKGEKKPVIMGSYGIGPGRLMGTIVETLSDDRGIIWPESVAPFQAHLILLQSDNAGSKEQAEYIYKILSEKGVEVLFDDRDVRAGEKFADADLIGIPYRITVSDRNAKAEKYELHYRPTSLDELLILDELIERFKGKP